MILHDTGYYQGMEILILTCLAILAAVAVFYLLVFPALLLLGMAISVGSGVIRGFSGFVKRCHQ